jgi:regulator of cell morphogenesis and NO signaling
MKLGTRITAEHRLNEVVQMYPESLATLQRLGLDACCGGAKTVAEAAAAHGLDVDEVLAELSLAAKERPR